MVEERKVELDRAQVKRAVQALQAFLKTKATGESLFLEESQQISLLFTLWKIPKDSQTIRIPLPHGPRPDTDEVCLFTRDEPKMTSDQTQRFYKKLLEERGVKNITEIIPFKTLKTEYKPFEAKRRLLGNFDMFLSDDRVRRLLPSHLGKHFYERKKEPLAVNLSSKNLARDIHRVIQGTNLKVNNKGCCCMARIANSGMSADDVTENIEAAVQTIMSKLRMKGPVIKLIHLKSETSVALPIYTSDLSHLTELEAEQKDRTPKKEGAANKKPSKRPKKDTNQTQEQKAKEEEEEKKKKKEEEEEEIPQLVPIATPSKKPKLEQTPKKKPVPKGQKAAAGMKKKAAVPKKAGKTKVQRRAPKAK